MSVTSIEFAEKYVDANGIRTRYLEAGTGEVCILIHGGGPGADAYTNWRYTIPILAEQCRVIAYDMVGFGESAKPEGGFEYSQDARNTQLRGFIDALELDDVTLVGNSMGAATAISAAVERPDVVARLIMMGAVGLPMELPEAIRPVLHYDYTREGLVRIIEGLTRDGYMPDREMLDYRYERSIRPDTRRAYEATMTWVRAHGGLAYEESYVARVKAPTLIAAGKLDKISTMDLAIQFLRVIPRSWGYFIPECGHWVMLERVDDFANIVLHFMKHAAL